MTCVCILMTTDGRRRSRAAGEGLSPFYSKRLTRSPTACVQSLIPYTFYFFFFFFQAEDGIRDSSVTGVQTCALPISRFIEGQTRREISQHRDSPGRSSRAGDI